MAISASSIAACILTERTGSAAIAFSISLRRRLLASMTSLETRGSSIAFLLVVLISPYLSRDIVLDLPLRITRAANQQRTYHYCYDYHRKVKDLHLEGMTTFVYPALMGFITACSIPIRLCPSSVLPPPSILVQCEGCFPRALLSLASFCPRCEVFFKAPEHFIPMRGVLLRGASPRRRESILDLVAVAQAS